MSLAGSLAKTNTSVRKNTSKVFSNGNKKPGKLGGITNSVSGIQKNVAGTVVGVGNIVAKAAGALGFKGLANYLTGSTTIEYNKKNQESQFVSGLRGFYKQFGGISLNQVDRVDPFNTFECEFRFFPSPVDVENVTKIDRTTDYSELDQDDYDNNRVETFEVDRTIKKGDDTVIGKLFKAIKFSNNIFSIKKVRDNQNQELDETNEFNGNGRKEYVVKTPVSNDMYVNLGIYIQKVTLPNIQIEGADESTTLVGRFPIPGNIVMPDNTNFSMDIVNTQAPVLENIFYPWMRETTLPWWSYDSQPFTTATITFDFTEHSNIKYHFFGCRPIQIMSIQPEQAANTSLTRNVQFSFDFMTIEALDASKPIEYVGMEKKEATSGKKNGDSWTNIANGALFSATNTLKF